MADFHGKVVVITGGAGDIGKAAAKLLAGDGAAVLLVDSNGKALDAAVVEIGNPRVSGCVADVTDVASTQAYIKAAVDRFGGIDVLLSNAGIEGKVTPIFDADPADFDRVIAVNVRGVWLSLKYAIPEMRKRGGGSIVISSSIAGLRGTAGVTPYCTSKHAVIGLMRAAALECAPLNIRVNTVNPSPVETRMMRSLEEGLMPGNPGEVHTMLKAMIPMQRYAEPDDIAKLMRFLASDDSTFITGSVYSADGGLNAG
ncbi:MAG: SDR family oxidoreductase [Rhodocyclaceae bacterium]|nr:SDR family oxidoreductase [Rhodocyclaceae bacterium]